MSDEAGNATQNQQQSQSVIVNVGNSSNPELESQIFERHSAGRQLGRITDVLAVVLDALAATLR